DKTMQPVKKSEPPSSQQPATSPVFLPGPFAWMTIPAGKVTLIENNYDDSYIKKGQNQIIEVPAFDIAKYPITNGQFAQFVEADGYQQQKWWKQAGWQVKEEKNWNEPRFWKQTQWNRPDNPVVGISWYEALAYCEWLSEARATKVTLPSEQQWQRAAQGN